MQAFTKKPRANETHAGLESPVRRQARNRPSASDHRPDVIAQRKLEASVNQGPRARRMASLQAIVNGRPTAGARQQGRKPGPSAVVQGVFTFLVNPDTYKIYNASYFRVQQTKYMTGSKEYKHVTADSVKDALFTGLEGLSLDAFAEKALELSNQYLHLPGLALVEAHKLYEEDNPIYAGLNESMIANFKEFEKVFGEIPYQSSNLSVALATFKSADTKEAKDAAAFLTQNLTMLLLASLEKFRDLMPLVNIVSGLQSPGAEREAKAFLEQGKTSKNIKNELEALWAFFDFAAIEEISGGDTDETWKLISESLPWLNVDELFYPISSITGLEPHEMDTSDLVDYLAGLMLANHIRLTTLAYPEAAKNAEFDSEESVLWALNKHDSPVDRKQVAGYAISL